MPKTLMARFTLTYIKIKFQNTKSQKLPDKKKVTILKIKISKLILTLQVRRAAVLSPLELIF